MTGCCANGTPLCAVLEGSVAMLSRAAAPAVPVGTGAVGPTDPPPVATAKVTLTPATGLPLASRAITDGGVATAVPAVAVWLLPPCTASDATAPALTVMVPEVACASPDASNSSVYLPAVPLRLSPLKLAAPFEPVVAV